MLGALVGKIGGGEISRGVDNEKENGEKWVDDGISQVKWASRVMILGSILRSVFVGLEILKVILASYFLGQAPAKATFAVHVSIMLKFCLHLRERAFIPPINSTMPLRF